MLGTWSLSPGAPLTPWRPGFLSKRPSARLVIKGLGRSRGHFARGPFSFGGESACEKFLTFWWFSQKIQRSGSDSRLVEDEAERQGLGDRLEGLDSDGDADQRYASPIAITLAPRSPSR